jgi:hypothetical protein
MDVVARVIGDVAVLVVDVLAVDVLDVEVLVVDVVVDVDRVDVAVDVGAAVVEGMPVGRAVAEIRALGHARRAGQGSARPEIATGMP